MWCTKLILISCISLAASRPQNQQNVETKTEKAEAQVESSNVSTSAWLPLASLPNQGFDKTHFYPQSNSFQYYHFPRYHVQSNIKTNREYRELLKDLSLDEPRNVFDKTADRPETMILAPKEEIRVGQVAKADAENGKLKTHAPLTNKPPSLAPYRLSPLFHFIQNQNTIAQDKIIRFRTTNSINEDDITTLILKPQSTAVAGVEGKAVSNPLSRAILREGTNVDILFEPSAVAIAGPGGIAHAQSDLEISYEYF